MHRRYYPNWKKRSVLRNSRRLSRTSGVTISGFLPRSNSSKGQVKTCSCLPSIRHICLRCSIQNIKRSSVHRSTGDTIFKDHYSYPSELLDQLTGRLQEKKGASNVIELPPLSSDFAGVELRVVYFRKRRWCSGIHRCMIISNVPEIHEIVYIVHLKRKEKRGGTVKQTARVRRKKITRIPGIAADPCESESNLGSVQSHKRRESESLDVLQRP